MSSTDAHTRVVRRRRLTAGLIAATSLALISVAAFVKRDPFADQYRVKAQFSSVLVLRKGAPVRIAGVNVGRVSSIDAGTGNTSIVTMDISDAGRPLHSDARFTIEPRLALEGNFYISLRPGTPSAAPLRSGQTVPVSQTATAVQLDQVMDVFESPTRHALQSTIRAFSDGLGPGKGSGASGADSLRRAVAEYDRALAPSTRLAAAARGRRHGDLTAALGSSADVVAQLAADPQQLAGLMTNYARVSSTLAAKDAQLAKTFEGLDATFTKMPVVLPRLDAALDDVSELVPPLRSALKKAPASLSATSTLLAQIDASVEADELPKLLTRLRPTTSALPELLRRTRDIAPLVTDVASCLDKTFIPALNQVVPDGNLTTGDPAWLELLHLGASAGGSSGGFDGNGSALRLGVTAGEQAVIGNIPNLGELETKIPLNSSMNPEWLGFGHFPPEKPGEKCAEQKLPDLSVRGANRPYDWMTPADAPAVSARSTRQAGRSARETLRRIMKLAKVSKP